MSVCREQIVRLLKAVCFCFAWSTLLLAEDLENQSINSGGGWTSNYENSSFTIMGETFQSATIPTTTRTVDLTSLATLSIAENQPVGTVVAEINSDDPHMSNFHMESGLGDENNSLFTIDANGTLRTASVLDYEAGSELSILVGAEHEHGSEYFVTEGNFTVSVLDIFEDMDGDGIEDHLDDDMDGDGFSNEYENEIGSDPMNAKSTPLNIGLVAWYPFDGNASDMSGNGNDGVVNGATLGEDRHGQTGKAYQFDGVDDFIQSESNLRVTGDQARTYSLWFKHEPQINYKFFGLMHSGSKFNNRLFELLFVSKYGNSSENKVTAHWWGNGNSFSSGDIQFQSWNQCAITYENGSISLFLNGTKLSSLSGSLDTTSSPLFIGKPTNYDHSFVHGSIDDVRIYNRALSEAEVQALYELEKPKIDLSSGLVAWYPFDGNASDMSGNHHHGIIQNEVLPGADRNGKEGAALTFDGIDDFISVPHHQDFNHYPLTASAWFKSEQNSSGVKPVINKYRNATWNGWVIGINEETQSITPHYLHSFGRQIIGAHHPTYNEVEQFEGAFDKNKWTHVSLVVDGTSGRLFIDGVLADEKNWTGEPGNATTSTDFRIGKYASSTQEYFFKGSIDDVRIYDRALSEDEILELYEFEAPPATTVPPRPNTFLIQSIQAGSTTDIDNLVVTDLDTSSVVYENNFSIAEDAQRNLALHYYPDTGGLEGGTSSDWNDFQENSPKNRVLNGKLRLETTGFNQNGSGGYNSRSHATYTGVLPENFLIEFDAQRMQWAGHSYFWVFYKDPSDNPAHYADGGLFSASRESNLKQLLIRFASAGSVFYDCGISYSGKGWIDRFEPTGSLQTPHRLGISLDGTVVSFFMNGNLMSSKDISEFIYDGNPIQNKAPINLDSIAELAVTENQPIGTVVGAFNATDPDGDDIAFSLASGEGDVDNALFNLTDEGLLTNAEVLDFEEAQTRSIRVEATDFQGASVSKQFTVSIVDEIENHEPRDLLLDGPLQIKENEEAGKVVGRFTATDPDGDELTFSLVDGNGDTNNADFEITATGELKTKVVFDFEEGQSKSIRVQARDQNGGSVAGSFTVVVLDDPEGEIKFEQDQFFTDGKSLEIGNLKILGMDDVNFSLGPDADGGMHLFILTQDGELKLTEQPRESKTYELKILVFNENGILAERIVVVNVTAPQKEDLHAANTSDPAYHESALMIRELSVVRDNWRNGHNPISSIGTRQGRDGLFVATAQPHGRKVGDSVVLSGVKGLRIEGIKNWNFIIDEVSEKSFRIRHFGKNVEGKPDGRLGQLAKQVTGTAYQTSGSDYLLGPWTFGHLLGNMVSEKDDPVEFYKHFANQWKNRQTVNGWPADDRLNTHNAMVPQVDGGLTLSNLPFRLLAIGNRIDLFHAKSMRQVADAGEGRFVFTMTQSFPLPFEETAIWKVHEKTQDEPFYTLIFEYGQPAGDFATLAKWAKDWHELEVTEGNLTEDDFTFTPTEEYLLKLNELTDRFSKRGSDIRKPNGNPINQVRTNDFIRSPLWQMREFNLVSKETAHEVKATPDRKTKLVVDEAFQSIDIGLWTTTTKNNPMVRENGLDEELAKPLARWINQRENYIVGADVGPRAPEWMEGPVANQPHELDGFSYKFQSENIRVNLARYKYSLSTCSGCHTGDTGTFFQMVRSTGSSTEPAFFARFMEGNGSGGMHVVNDHENFEEKHEFFDLKGREEIARDILHISQQVDEARLRLNRTEFDLNGFQAPAYVSVDGGILADWEYELPNGREDNDFYTLNASTGELSVRGNGSSPPAGSGKIFLRARATDGTGVVIERPYSLWILDDGDERVAEDLDPGIQSLKIPPLVTARPNRTH